MEKLLKNVTYFGLPDDASEEVKKALKDIYCGFEDFSADNADLIDQHVFTVNYYDTIRNLAYKNHYYQNHGYVLLTDAKKVVAGALNQELHYINEESYQVLSNKEKSRYTYFEWNDSGSPFSSFEATTLIYHVMEFILLHYSWEMFASGGISPSDIEKAKKEVRLLIFTGEGTKR